MRHTGYKGPLSADEQAQLWQERFAHYEQRVRDLTREYGGLPPPYAKKEILKAATLAKKAKSNLRRARLAQALFQSRKRSP